MAQTKGAKVPLVLSLLLSLCIFSGLADASEQLPRRRGLAEASKKVLGGGRRQLQATGNLGTGLPKPNITPSPKPAQKGPKGPKRRPKPRPKTRPKTRPKRPSPAGAKKNVGKKFPPPPPPSRPKISTPGMRRVRMFLNFLETQAPEFTFFRNLVEVTGFNNTLADISDRYRVTILLPTNAACLKSLQASQALQMLYFHTLLDTWTGAELQNTPAGTMIPTALGFPSPPNPQWMPTTYAYKLNEDVLQLNGDMGDTSGVPLKDDDFYQDKNGLWAHVVEKFMDLPR